MKKILSLTLVLCFILGMFSVIPASAVGEIFKTDDGLEFTLKADNTLELIYCNGRNKNTVIPESFNGYTVTSIGEKCFTLCQFVETVSLPDTITVINNHAFSMCTRMKSIKLSDNIEFIGDEAFKFCVSLESIVIPASLKSCGTNPFVENGIKSVTFEDGMTEIPDGLFEKCANLNEVNLPESIEIVGERAFAGCDSLYSVNVPKNIKTIEDYAFGYKMPEDNTDDTPVSMEKEFTIFGYMDTVANTYADLNGLNFEPVDYEFIIGDVDLNGIVNVFDATLVQKYSSKITTLNEYQLKNANANNDDVVNVFDATEIQRMIAGLVK